RVTLAGDGPAALRRMAEALRERAADGQRDLAALRADAAVLSTRGSHRLAVVADSAGDLVRRLDAYLDGASMPGVRGGSAERAPGPPVVADSPQGSQWLGMGRGLIAAEPVFKAVLERCDRVVRDEAGWSLLEELSADPAHSRLDEVDVVQPLISCVQMALTELWRSWGVVPDVVVGHSLGEVAAAYAAGILDLEDAVRLICVYSRMQTRPECRGGKAIINLPADDAARLVEPYGGRVVVAGLNGPASTLLSGDADALDEVVAACAARSVFAARVQVNVAVHNPRFESVVADMTAALSWLRPRSARIPMVSTVDARAIAGPECRGEYWARNLRQPVLFWPVIRELLATGHRAFVEVSPHGILTHALKQAFEHEGVAGLCVPTLRRGDDERASMLDTLGALYVEGRTITINGTRADGGEDSEVAHILPLSARSAGALEDLAREFVRRLEAPGEGTARDICYTAAARRAHLDHRLAVVAATRRELSARLDGVLRGEEPAGVARGRVRLAGRPRIVFAFAGQGPQWWGIGRDLLEREPVFRSVVYQCRDLLAAHADWDLLEELMRDEASSRLNESEVAQPALFAFQVRLAALRRSWGIEPEAVVGRIMGEVAAAHAAGALSLEDAVRVIYRRGRVMQEAAGRGAMVAVQLPAERA